MKNPDNDEIRTIRRQMKVLRDPVAARRFLQQTLGVDRFMRHRQIDKVGALPLHLEIYPNAAEAPVVIFLPGIGTYTEMYAELFHHLHDQGFTVVGLDLRGHGYSGGQRGRYTVEEVVDDIDEVIAHLQPRFQGPVVMLGSSIGAPLAVAAAERIPAIRGVLCHTLFLSELPPDIFHLWGWIWLASMSWFWPNVRADFRGFVDVDLLLQNSPFRHFVDYDELLVWDYPLSTLANVYTHRSQVMWRDCEFPALILIGEDDEVLSTTYEHQLAALARHPFEVEVVAGGHMLPLEQAKDMAAVAARWFKRVLAEGE